MSTPARGVRPIVSSESKIKTLLWTFAAYLTLCACLACMAVPFSRSTNLRWMHYSHHLNSNFPIRTDPRQLRMTNAFFQHDCEIAHTALCGDIRDSDAVHDIRTHLVPPLTGQLLQHNSYSSAYNLLSELSLLGADAEVVNVSGNEHFDIGTLSHFAASWYLRPAETYVQNNREQDAVTQYELFASILRPHIRRGEWLSLLGIDETDLPVLTDTFCVQEQEVDRNLCTIGILKTLARVDADQSSNDQNSNDPDREDIQYGIKTSSFLDKYNRLNPRLRSKALADYLSVWLWHGRGTPPASETSLTPVQQSLWYYAIAVVERNLARTLADGGSSPDCLTVLSTSVDEFRLAGTVAQDGGYVSAAATRAAEDLHNKGDDFCQPSKRSKKL
jgi:hypothetical protein